MIRSNYQFHPLKSSITLFSLIFYLLPHYFKNDLCHLHNRIRPLMALAGVKYIRTAAGPCRFKIPSGFEIEVSNALI